MNLSDNVKKNIIVWFSCFYVFTTGSILFGWPAIYPIAVDEGQYSELCVYNTTFNSGDILEYSNSSSSSDFSSYDSSSEYEGTKLCPEQKVRLNLVFTLGYLFIGFSNLCGILTDKIGPKLSNILGTSSVIIGLTMWTVSDSKTTDMWIPGAIFLGFGGSLTFYANFHIVNLLTTYRTLVVSLISGIWNAGGLNMSLVQILYFNFGVSRKLSLACVDVFIVIIFLINTLFLCPFKPYMPGDKPEIKPIWVEIREYLNDRKQKKAEKEKEAIELSNSVINDQHSTNSSIATYKYDSDFEADISLDAPDAKEPGFFSSHPQLRYFLKNFFSARFLAVLAFGVTGGYTVSYGLGTMEYQFADLTRKEEFYSQMFSIVACIGLVIIPLWSFMINKLGLFAFGICIMCLEGVFYAALVTRWMPAIVVDFFVFSFARVGIGAAVSNYNRMFFDINLFGTFTGIVWFVNSLVTQTQTPIVNFVLKKLNENWIYPNLIFMFTPLLGIFYVVSSYRFEKQKKQATAEEESSNLILAVDEPSRRSLSEYYGDADMGADEDDDIVAIVTSPESENTF